MCWKTQLNRRGSKDVCVRVWFCSAPAGRCCRAAPCWGSCPGMSVQLWWGVLDPCSAVDVVSVPGTPGPSALPQGPGPTGQCHCTGVRGCWTSAAHTVQLQMGLGPAHSSNPRTEVSGILCCYSPGLGGARIFVASVAGVCGVAVAALLPGCSSLLVKQLGLAFGGLWHPCPAGVCKSCSVGLSLSQSPVGVTDCRDLGTSGCSRASGTAELLVTGTAGLI